MKTTSTNPIWESVKQGARETPHDMLEPLAAMVRGMKRLVASFLKKR